MFQGIGESTLTASVKKMGQTGIAAFGNSSLGKKFGLDKLSLGKKDGQEARSALWVQLAAGESATQPGGAFSHLPGMDMMPHFGSPAPAGGAAAAAPSFMKSLLGAFGMGGLFGGGGTGGPTPSVTQGGMADSFQLMAGGGDMSADKAYIAGDQGPEVIRGINAHVMSNSASRKLVAGAGGDHYYSIDARGTDPVQTEERVRQSIMAAHNSAISTSQQVTADRVRRTPTKSSR
jgi:hypothetical protein